MATDMPPVRTALTHLARVTTFTIMLVGACVAPLVVLAVLASLAAGLRALTG